MKAPSLRHILMVIGPGILVAATGVGAGDLATGAISGSRLGVAILWAVVLGAFLKFVLTEGIARYQLVTGQSLLDGAVQHLGPIVRFVFLAYLLIWSVFVGSALMSACGVAAHAIWPVFDGVVIGAFRDATLGKIVFGILHSALGVALVLIGGFKLFEKIMSICIAVMFCTVIVTAAMLVENWASVGSGLVVPRIPRAGADTLGWTIALMGGVGGTLTVLCYGYWIREKGRSGPDQLRTCRIDLGVGYIFTALFGIAMVIIGSRLAPVGKGASLVVDLANQLEATSLGRAGRWAFLIGAWGALFSSLLGVWQAVPYVFADFLTQVRQRSGHTGTNAVVEASTVDPRSRAYRGYLLGIAIVPICGLFISFSAVQKYYAVFGACFMPLLAVVLLLLNGRTKWIGTRHRNRPLTVIVLIVTIAMFVAALAFKVQKLM